MARKSITKTGIARGYIKEKVGSKTKNEIIENIIDITGLKYETIEKIYKDIKSEFDIIQRYKSKKNKEKEEEVLFKGKKRKFFRFDDSKLPISKRY